MKVFHHGGRIGDLIFALYTMKALGGGRLLVSDYHRGNWSLGIAKTMCGFLFAQPYIKDVQFVSHASLRLFESVDYDLQHAEDDYNPEAFPEWDKRVWPGNCNIRKRYAVHFGVDYEPDAVWLTAPQTKNVDIAIHWPQRRSVRRLLDWLYILEGLFDLKATILGAGSIEGDLLETADYINSAKVFLGTVSCCNALAEGLGKRRLVEQAPDCFNVNASGLGCSINGLSNAQVVKLVRIACELQ